MVRRLRPVNFWGRVIKFSKIEKSDGLVVVDNAKVKCLNNFCSQVALVKMQDARQCAYIKRVKATS